MNVVIPIIQPEDNPREVHPFPWAFVVKSLGVLAAALVAGLYLFRIGKEGYLAALSRGTGIRNLRALMRLALMKIAAEGIAPKRPAQTPLEYAEEHPWFSEFASLYTVLRYRRRMSGAERERLWKRIRSAYGEAVRQAREAQRERGSRLVCWLRRVFSLRGLSA